MEQVRPDESQDMVATVAGLDRDDGRVKAALYDELRQSGGFYRQNAALVGHKAKREAQDVVSAPKKDGESRELGLNPEAALISSALAKRLEPWARQLRQRCFDGPEPPFREWSEAVEWIRSKVRKNREAWQNDPVSRRDVEAEIYQLADLAGLEVKTEPRWLRHYEHGNEYQQLAGAFPGTMIEELAREINRVSEETAFHPVVLTAFVLSGASPAIARIRITTTSKTCHVPGDRIRSRWVNIRFNAADVSDAELRALYSDVREFFGAKGSQRITKGEAEFLSLVDDMGGPPESGKSRFWEKVSRRWKSEPALNSGTAARNKYHRLSKRIDLRALATPNRDIE